jgi:hypothetical protein
MAPSTAANREKSLLANTGQENLGRFRSKRVLYTDN